MERSRSPRNKHCQTSGKTLKDPAEIAEVLVEIGQNRDTSSRRSYGSNSLTTSETPPKNVADIQRKKFPQYQSRSLELFSIYDTDKNPEKSNIQDVEKHLVKINNNDHKSDRASLGRIQKGGASTSPPTR